MRSEELLITQSFHLYFSEALQTATSLAKPERRLCIRLYILYNDKTTQFSKYDSQPFHKGDQGVFPTSLQLTRECVGSDVENGVELKFL